MEILKQITKISELAMSTIEKQKDINVSEVFHLWNHLMQRYDVINLTNIFENYAKDDDLKLVISVGRRTLSSHVTILEKEMMNYGIPLPVRPPKHAQTAVDMNILSDRYIYRRILRGIQSFLNTHMTAFIHSTSPKIRGLFMTFLIEEMKLYDKFLEYGKIKSYEIMPPNYKQ